MVCTRRGFTLIEIAVLIVIVGLLAVAVSIRSAGWFRSARIQDIVSQLNNFDRQARSYTKRFNRAVRLEFDLDQGTIVRVDPATQQPMTHRIQLPRGFAIKQVSTVTGQIHSGQVTIPCSTAAHTPTYAVSISGPNRQSRQILVVGTTGQMVLLNHEREISNTFALLAPQTDIR